MALLPSSELRSWGLLYPPARRVRRAGDPLDLSTGSGSLLAYGNGRSYGDVCLNSEGTLLDMRGRSAVLGFDTETGVLRAEAGVMLSELLDIIVPRGWFLPVSPGTRFVTLGGAIANDVHGKNHHVAGSFGRHVRRLELARSDGTRIVCGPDENPRWFEATVAGLGLTGIIVWAEIQLLPLPSAAIDVESIRFPNLSTFFRIAEETNETHDYTVAWVDCLARGEGMGRGWMMAGNHAPAGSSVPRGPRRELNFFFQPPFSLVNRWSLRAFNAFYYRRSVRARALVDYRRFFYPLDGIRNWNRMYGPRGFYQFQSVVPPQGGEAVVRELLDRIARERCGSFLAVLKQFGSLASPGMLSFPRPGPTLALDFANRGPETAALLEGLEAIVMEAGGAIYPAKDACMSADSFQAAFPRWREVESMRDPALDSDFWRRVTRRG